jgi:predicted AlkP superfamily phosphohydrolase/phosphomutase
MNDLVMIGIDSMDRELVAKYLSDLPVIRRLMEESPEVTMRSTFPPDSDTAWASIYTGLNPARHGVVNFVDPLEKTSIYQTDYLDSRRVMGKTFWDIAGKAGRRVCLLFPHIGYPVWEINGIMVSRIPKKDGFAVYPPATTLDANLGALEIPKRVPNSTAEYEEYCTTFERVVRHEFAFARRMLAAGGWDLFFFYSPALDFIQHIFWNYCDPEDPSFPGEENPYRSVIHDFYVLYDTLLGELLAGVPAGTPVVILSDHGHSMRPIELFNINEILRREGYLAQKTGASIPLKKASERVKRGVANLVQKTALRGTALRMLRKHPMIKEFYTVPSLIDFDRTVARCTDLSGVKSYTYGGIVLSRAQLPEAGAYEQTRAAIIDLLAAHTIPGSDEAIFEWVRRREDLYEGEYLDRWPDIIFKLREGYGAGWAINVPLFSLAATHNFYPGSHRGDTPVLYLKNLNGKTVKRRQIDLMDISPTVLDLMGIDRRDCAFDGESIFAERAPSSP